MKYKPVTAIVVENHRNVEDLESKVNEAIKEGWIPFGSPCVIERNKGMKCSFVLQNMYKPETPSHEEIMEFIEKEKGRNYGNN